MNKSFGISLLELMITVALIAILISTGFTSFDNSIREEKTISASEQIMAAIKKAKYHARSKGVLTSLVFPAGSNNYSIIADGEIISNNALFDASSGVLPENIVIIQSTCNDINFYVDGSLVDSEGEVVSEDCSVRLGYINGNQKIITVKGNTGNVIQQ